MNGITNAGVINADGAGQADLVRAVGQQVVNSAFHEAVNNIAAATVLASGGVAMATVLADQEFAPLTAANLAAHTQATHNLFGPPSSTNDESGSSTDDGQTTFASETWTVVNSSYDEFSLGTHPPASDATDHG